jgi:hypothetical protein
MEVPIMTETSASAGRFGIPDPPGRDRLLLGLIAVVALVLALWVRDEKAASNLALVLAAVAGLLALVALLLPYLSGLSGSFGGVAVTLDFSGARSSGSTREVSGFSGHVDPATGKATLTSGSTGLKTVLDGPDIQYVAVDLGRGEQWLASRLLVFTVVLQELRGVECVVLTAFPESPSQSGSTFVGLVSPDDLRRSLAWEYPWLETALSQAWENVSQPPVPLPAVPGGPGAPRPRRVAGLNPTTAEVLYQAYVALLRGGVPGADPDNWRELQIGDWEHSPMLTGALVTHLLGQALDVRAAHASRSHSRRIAEILAIEAPYVAVVDRGHRFDSLVDRQALLEEMAAVRS